MATSAGLNLAINTLKPFGYWQCTETTGTTLNNEDAPVPVTTAPFSSSYTTGNYSTSFNGTTAILTLAGGQTAFAFGTGDFTVEFWVKLNSIGTQYNLVDFRTINTNGIFPLIYITSGNLIAYYVNSTTVITGTALAANTWYHVALSRVSGSTKMFLNGTQVGSTYTDTNNYLIGAISRPSIGGSFSNTTPYYLDGYISNLRILKGTGLYSSNFTAPTAPLSVVANTSLMTCNATTITDSSNNNFTITANGDTTSDMGIVSQVTTSLLLTDGSSFTDSSGNGFTANNNGSVTASSTGGPFTGANVFTFNGTSQSLTYPGGQTAFSFGADDFTIEFWLNLSGLGVQQNLIDFRTINTSGFFPVIWLTTGNVLTLTVNATNVITGNALTSNTWYHIALCKGGSQTEMFVNGTQVGTSYADTNTYSVGAVNRPSIGASFGNTSPFYVNGKMSNIRIVKGKAIYSSSFTTPTTTLTTTLTPYILANRELITGDTTKFLELNGARASKTGSATMTAGFVGDITFSCLLELVETIDPQMAQSPIIFTYQATGDTAPANALLNLYFNINNSNSLTFFHEYGTGSNEGQSFSATLTGTYPVSQTFKSHIIITRDSSKYILWVNGHKRARLDFANPPSGGGSSDLYLGTTYDHRPSAHMTIGHMCAFNRVLTDDEIWSLFVASGYATGTQTVLEYTANSSVELTRDYVTPTSNKNLSISTDPLVDLFVLNPESAYSLS